MKREVRLPKRFTEEFSFKCSQVEAKRKVTKPDKTLNEIKIFDIKEAQDEVKIHYTAYVSVSRKADQIQRQ